MSQKDEEVVRTFLNEAVLGLGLGNVDVFYSPGEEVYSSEPESYLFFHRGLCVEVVESASHWARVENESIEDLGAPDMVGPLWDAVTESGRVIRDVSDMSEDQRRYISASFDAYHERGRKGAADLVRKAMANGQD